MKTNDEKPKTEWIGEIVFEDPETGQTYALVTEYGITKHGKFGAIDKTLYTVADKE